MFGDLERRESVQGPSYPHTVYMSLFVPLFQIKRLDLNKPEKVRAVCTETDQNYRGGYLFGSSR